MEDIKITFVGDIMCEPLMINAAKTRDNDFGFVFENVKDLFSEADFAVGNLFFC